ncbi:UNVERIFIED_CONTAM: hypothetical protein GTU68_065737, partial [Idotea baltica]|nr:hypothetical protein [Idotea baltica]
GLTCILVDDGSPEKIKARLRSRVSHLSKKDKAECHLLEHEENQGKGAAVFTGARVARSFGFTHFVQIDADGQHAIDDVAVFIKESQSYPWDIISGAPQFDETAPKARLYGRKVTDFWVSLETLSLSIRDSLCGFRVYPLSVFHDVYERSSVGSRMDFDTDFLVKSIWLNYQFRFLPTKVSYQENNDSNFHYLHDNVRLVWLHIRLMCGML